MLVNRFEIGARMIIRMKPDAESIQQLLSERIIVGIKFVKMSMIKTINLSCNFPGYPLIKLTVICYFDRCSYMDTKTAKMHNVIVAVIPCYNVDKFCEPVVREVLPLVTHIIAVNDGSTDDTGEVLQRLAREHPKKMNIISFANNRGKGFGLLDGFKYALHYLDFNVLITFDADGQHLAPYLVTLAKSIENGAETVVGGRTFNEMPLRSRLGNSITSWLLRSFYSKAPTDTQSGMRAYSKNFVSEIVKHIPGGHYEMEFRCLLLALKQNRKIDEIPISTIYINKNRSSHFCRWKDSFIMMKTLFWHLCGRT